MKKASSTLLKKLGSYSALAVPMLAGTSLAQGQIIYTDVNPDITVHGNNFAYILDLNNDQTTDFVLAVRDTLLKANGTNINIKKLLGVVYSSNSMAATTVKSNGYTFVHPLALDAGELINADLAWNHVQTNSIASVYNYVTASSSYKGGQWLSAKDKYMPLRFKSGGNQYYGWARLTTIVRNDTASFTIKGYAYDATPDEAIAAGDTGTSVGIHELAGNGINIYEYKRTVFVNFTGSNKGDELIRVVNMSGQEVRQFYANRNEFSFSMADMPSGLYLVTVEENGQIVKSRKISLN